ncbi:MAG TPA: hydantoinase/oxoprolinase family protein, partial [Chloroflexota bacterium]
GYLNPDGFGRRQGFRLDRERAVAAFQPLATRLGFDVLTAALGVHRVVNAAMVDRIRLISLKRGYDPRRYVLVAFGGAGPLHGPALLAELPIRGVLIPARPGVLSAIGLAWGATEHDSQLALHRALTELTAAELQARLTELDEVGRRALHAEGVGAGIVAEATAAVRYVGQSYELDVPISLTGSSAEAIGAAFQAKHEEVYGYANPGLPVEVVGLRLTHRRSTVAPLPLATGTGDGQPFAERAALFPGVARPVPTPVHWRADLTAEQVILGPAVIEQEDATTIVYPGQRCRRLPTGGLFVDREAEQ